MRSRPLGSIAVLVGIAVSASSLFLCCSCDLADPLTYNDEATTSSSPFSYATPPSPALEAQSVAAVQSPWSESDLEHVVRSWNFNEQEQEALTQFQQRIFDIQHWKNDPAEAAHFLKEHNFNLDKAEHMFRGMVQWRLDNDIDTFMERYGEPPEIFRYTQIFLLKGLDKDQDPIFVQRIGKMDGWGLYKSMGDTAMHQAHRFVSELQTSREYGIRNDWRWQSGYYEPLTGRRVTQLTILVDLEGLSVRLLRPALFRILKQMARVSQDHYPGLAKRVIVIRSPHIFKMAWKVVKHFYDSRVHDKFIFVDQDDYLQVLSDYVDLDVLPSVIYEHGNGQPMPGWFEKIRMEDDLIVTEGEEL